MDAEQYGRGAGDLDTAGNLGGTCIRISENKAVTDQVVKRLGHIVIVGQGTVLSPLHVSLVLLLQMRSRQPYRCLMRVGDADLAHHRQLRWEGFAEAR